MKSALYLIAVLCVSAQVIDGFKDVVFAVTDKDHADKTKRTLQFDCSYTRETGDTGTILTVQFKATGGNTDIYKQTDGQKPTVTPFAGKIEDITYDDKVTDNAKITFTVKKVTAAQGTYVCMVGQLTKEVVVYETAEILTFNLQAEKDDGNFAKGNELKGTCTWDLPTVPTGLTFDSLAVIHGTETIMNTKSDNTLDIKGGAGIDKKKLETSAYKDKVLSVIIKDAVEEMKGSYKCQLNYKEGATAKTPLEVTAKELKYTGAGSAAMASFLSVSSLLVLVVSYMKMF